MGKLVLITGGSRSGKSVIAEEMLHDCQNVCYLATNPPVTADVEMQRRIQQHKERRPAHWVTEERFSQLAPWLRKQHYDYYLLDCVTMLTFHYFYHHMEQQYGTDYQQIDTAVKLFSTTEKKQYEQVILAEWQQIIATIRELDATFILVTNEVGWGIVPEDNFSRWFRDVYGLVNQYLGKAADEVQLVVAGLPVWIKK